jgi:hypothetical protein
MQEGDSLSLCADTRCLVDELKSGLLASREGSVQIVHGEADVMDAGAAFGQELSDRGCGLVWLEEFDERLTGDEAGDVRTVGVVERDLSETQQVAVEREDRLERFDGDANVSNACPAVLLFGGVHEQWRLRDRARGTGRRNVSAGRWCVSPRPRTE